MANFADLQAVLQLAHSEDLTKQQKAVMELVKIVDGNPFPSVSFGPLIHALCKLIPSDNRTVSSYAARSLKMLLIDDALRPQTATIVPKVVCDAILYWEDEVLCLRELLPCLQNLTYDKICVKHVINYPDIFNSLFELAQSADAEVSVSSVANIANILSYADTAVLLSVEHGLVDVISNGMNILIELIKNSQGVQKFYATAAVANAATHPIFNGNLNNLGALQLMKGIESQNMVNLHIFGSRIGDCAQTAIVRLSNGAEGLSSYGKEKYIFKWGTKPVMEVTIASLKGYADQRSVMMTTCLFIWCIIVVYLLFPFFTYN